MGDSDQAARLRQLVQEKTGDLDLHQLSDAKARVIAVSSGKGGVGKTNIAANIAIALVSLGKRVAIVDADYSLANIDILLGFNPKYTIEHVLSGEKSIGEILIEGPGGIRVIPAASGVQHLSSLTGMQLHKFFNSMQILEKHFQFLLLDTSAGISDNVVNILRSAHEVLVVTNPEPPAFVDSYALIKHLLGVKVDATIRVIVNSVRSEREARSIFESIFSTVKRFLNGRISYLGHVLEDDSVRMSVRAQRAFILRYPNSPASRCVAALARKQLESGGDIGGGQFFWQTLKNSVNQMATGD